MGTYYVDEEDCLGFKVWVAELELMVGNARGKKKVDPLQCFQLLQKLVVALDRTDRLEVKEYQRRCEDALVDILLKGAPPPVSGASGRDRPAMTARTCTRTCASPDAGLPFSCCTRLGRKCHLGCASIKGMWCQLQRRPWATLPTLPCCPARLQVRKLICEALGRMYSTGDQLPLYSRVSSLQLFLGTKEAFSKETSEDIRLGALECMASLYYSQGRFLSIGVNETTQLAVKYCTKCVVGLPSRRVVGGCTSLRRRVAVVGEWGAREQ